jgi:hypothetical protein
MKKSLPRNLQSLFEHADRLCDLLAILELTPPSDEWAAAWLAGRAEELARFVQDVIESWCDGRVSDARATAMLDGYLGLLHEGLATHLGDHDPWCCNPTSPTPPVRVAITADSTTVERLAGIV